MTQAQRIANFEKLPVKRAVLKQILPAIASQVIMLIYNLADTYFVGRLNDPRQTAGMTAAASSLILITAIANLFGVGGGSAMGRFLGRQDSASARNTAAVAFYGALASSVALCAGYYALAGPILRLCGATPDIWDSAYGYAVWVMVIGGPAAVMSAMMANLIRAEGGANVASFGLSAGGVLNIVLDPLFTLPRFWDRGAVGAGMATAIANWAVFLFFLVYVTVRRGQGIIDLHPAHCRRGLVHLKSVLAVGFPSAVQYLLTAVAVAAQMHFVSRYDAAALAALGIVKKLDMVPLYCALGVSAGLLPLLSYTYAAGQHRRFREALGYGVKIAVGFSLLCVAVYELFAPFFVSLFIGEALTRQYGAAFLRLMVIAMPMMSVCNPLIISFQAVGRVRESLVCSLLRKGVLDIPFLFIMDSVWPLYGCMLVQPMVDAISMAAALVCYRRIAGELKGEDRI